MYYASGLAEKEAESWEVIGQIIQLNIGRFLRTGPGELLSSPLVPIWDWGKGQAMSLKNLQRARFCFGFS